MPPKNVKIMPELQSFLNMRHLADNADDVDAQFVLAVYYLNTAQEHMRQKAFSILKKLANRSYTQVQTDARYLLAICYENGYGIAKSYPRAIRWYEMAAGNVSNDLIYNPDPVGEAANKKLEEIMEAQNGDIDEALDEILCGGEIDPGQLACMAEAAEIGDIEAQIYLMNLYWTGGGGIEANEEESAYWAEKAAENGSIEAMSKIGYIYYYGSGAERDPEKALYWLEQAAAQESEASAQLLGEYYRSQKQYKEAVKWYRRYAGLKLAWRNKRLGWGEDKNTER